MSSIAPLQELVRILIRDNPHDVLVPLRDRLERALDWLGDSSPYQTAALCTLWYDRKYGRFPDSFDTLRSYIGLNPDSKKNLVHAEAIVLPELDELAALFTPLPNLDFLVTATVEAGRVAYYIGTYKLAQAIANGSMEWPKKDGKSGIDAARQWVQHRQERDIFVGGKTLDGGWVEHAPEISKMLDDHLDNAERYRIYTGFQKIDDHVVIGPKNQRWIGILGYTSHGKSAFLLAMIYNMARAGHRVLLVPREFSADEAWLRLTFMHSEHVEHGDMGSLDQWVLRPSTVTEDQRIAKNLVLKDLQDRVTLKGGIDVKQLARWEEIVDHLEANKKRWGHDVLAVDYLAHLEVEGRDQMEAKKQLFRKAQMLSMDYNNGEGLVVITPLQANKKGMEDAAAREGALKGVYENLGAVDWFTQAAQDMSLVLSVWHEDNKDVDFKIHCLKSKGQTFPDHLVYLNPETRYIADQPVVASPQQQMWDPDFPDAASRVVEEIPVEFPS
jgi:KaiC/GvpD/RAD55 family RecA-like ATPase